MKKVIFAGMVLAFGSVNVLGDCSANSKTLASVLAGKSVDASSSTNENWKESHCGLGTSGQLWKVGTPPENGKPSVDPAVHIGSWKTSGQTVTYNYGSGGSYTWTLHTDDDITYFFCDGTSEIASGTLGALGGCS